MTASFIPGIPISKHHHNRSSITSLTCSAFTPLTSTSPRSTCKRTYPTSTKRIEHDTDGLALPSRRKQTNSTSMIFNLFKRKEEPMQEVNVEELSKHYPAIQVDNLTKTFNKKLAGIGNKKKRTEKQRITAVDNLSFEVPRGSIFALLGPNSCGKTTTMRCMGTITEADEGSIKYYGLNIDDNEALARHMIGYVMQNAGVDKTLTGREHLEFFSGLAHLSKHERDSHIEILIDLLKLEDFIDRLSSTYSGGILKRLDLAIALLHQPPILILDEPTVGLDIESRSIIWNVLRHWRHHGGTILFSSHYLEEVDLLSDYVAIMDKGIIIAQGTPTQLKNSLGGDRISIRLTEFTKLDEAEVVIQHLKDQQLVLDAIVNANRSNALELIVTANDATIGGKIISSLATIGHDKLFSFSQAKPSLDDVYLAATGQSILDAENFARSNRTEKSLRKESMT